MPIDRKYIGVVSEPCVAEVDKGMLKFFAKATGETNPVYFDEDAAAAAGYPAIPAPPTYTTVLASAVPPQGVNLLAMGVDLRRILHGEQSYSHHCMIFAGDTITLTTRISDIYDKKGGALEFIVSETSAVNQRGELCTEMRSVLVIRNG